MTLKIMCARSMTAAVNALAGGELCLQCTNGRERDVESLTGCARELARQRIDDRGHRAGAQDFERHVFIPARCRLP